MGPALLGETQKLQYHLHPVRLQYKSVVCSQEEGPHWNVTLLVKALCVIDYSTPTTYSQLGLQSKIIFNFH